MSYEQEDQDAISLKWIVIFVLLSLLAHALLIVGMILLSKHIPTPRLEPKAQDPTVALTLVQPPPVAAPKPIFMVTPDQKNTKPHQSQVQSDHDTKLASKSKTDRKNDTIMPDVVSPDKHASSLQSSPSAPPSQKQESPATPPTPAKEQAKPTPPQPQQPPQPKADPSKTPPQQSKTPPPPTPAPTPPKVPPPPAVDANGLPVLPALSAPPMAAPTATTAAQQAQQAAPPPTMPVVPANVEGRAGMSGAPTPDAMKTELGAYKARFYNAVGSRWYQKVGQQMQLIGVGRVHVQYTIYKDGTITTQVLDTGGGSMQILLTISVNSIRECSPFYPFSDAMIKQVGDSYTDDYWFSVY
jgi:hypothetical protein